MSFTKNLLVASVIAANISLAEQEHVYYTCSTNSTSLAAFSLHFNRDQNWASSWDWHGDWNNQEWPTFETTAIINLPHRAVDGKVHGQFLGGHTRLTGYTRITIDTENSPLKLSILERPTGIIAGGEGSYMGEGLSISCKIAAEADQSIDSIAKYKRYRWVYENGKRVCVDDKTGNIVRDGLCRGYGG